MCNSGYAFIIFLIEFFSRKVFARKVGNISQIYRAERSRALRLRSTQRERRMKIRKFVLYLPFNQNLHVFTCTGGAGLMVNEYVRDPLF